MLTGQDEVDGLIAGQSVRVAEQMEGSQTPIDAIQTKVLRQPILELILTLSADQSLHRSSRPGTERTLSKVWIYAT